MQPEVAGALAADRALAASEGRQDALEFALGLGLHPEAASAYADDVAAALAGPEPWRTPQAGP